MNDLLNAEVLDALGHRGRRQILSLLVKRSRTLDELRDCLSMSRATLTRHLRVLLDAELIENCPLGQRRVGFRVRPSGLDAVCDFVCRLRLQAQKLSLAKSVDEGM